MPEALKENAPTTSERVGLSVLLGAERYLNAVCWCVLDTGIKSMPMNNSPNIHLLKGEINTPPMISTFSYSLFSCLLIAL